MHKRLEDVVKAYSAVIGLLESPLISAYRRKYLESMRENLEREMELLKEDPPQDIAAD